MRRRSRCAAARGRSCAGSLPAGLAFADRFEDTQTMTDKVLYRQDGQIVTITLNDPAMRNPISERETVDAIVAAIERLNQDATARVAILTGAGNAFSSGGDLRAMKKNFEERAKQPALTTQYYKFGIQ